MLFPSVKGVVRSFHSFLFAVPLFHHPLQATLPSKNGYSFMASTLSIRLLVAGVCFLLYRYVVSTAVGCTQYSNQQSSPHMTCFSEMNQGTYFIPCTSSEYYYFHIFLIKTTPILFHVVVQRYIRLLLDILQSKTIIS